MSTPESEVLKSICDYLYYKGYCFWRTNNTGIYDKKINGFRKMPTYSMKGVSDVIVIVEGKAHFIECKAGYGKQSQDQKDFEEYVTTTGEAKYYVVKSIDDLINYGF